MPAPTSWQVPKGVGICDECAVTAHTVAQEALRPHGADRLVTGIGRLMTNDPAWGNSFGIIDRAAVAIRRGRVAWVWGPRRRYRANSATCRGWTAGAGWVFPGSSTPSARWPGPPGSQAPSEETPVGEVATEWAGRLLAGGATFLSISVGTRGDPEEDKERLAAANLLKQRLPIKVATSWRVGPDAGISPQDGDGKRILRDMAQYASGLSITVGAGGFSPVEARRLCSTMGSLRKRVRLHGAPDIPAESVRSIRPLAVQDMTQLDEWTLQALRTGGGAVVVLPMNSIRARLPIRGLIDLGIPVALGTGCLPGGRSVTSMPFLAWVASEAGDVPMETALWCATFGGAQALGDRARGWIRRGAAGDIAILEAAGFGELADHPDLPMVWELIREGDLTSAGQPDDAGD